MYSSSVMKFRCSKCGNLFGCGLSSTKSRNYEAEKDWKSGYNRLNLVDEKIHLFCSNKCMNAWAEEHGSEE